MLLVNCLTFLGAAVMAAPLEKARFTPSPEFRAAVEGFDIVEPIKSPSVPVLETRKERDYDTAAAAHDNYIVLFNREASLQKRDDHHKWLKEMMDKPKPINSSFSINITNAIHGYLNFSSHHGYYGRFPKDVIEQIRSRGKGVAIVERDSFDKGADYTSVQYDAPWGLNRISHKEYTGNGVVNHDSTYVFNSKDGSNTTIYIVDSGIRDDHIEFNNRIRYGPNYIDNSNSDAQGHGTAIAGIAAGFNTGVAKYANIVSLKVMDSQKRVAISSTIQAIEWIIEDHKKNPGQRSIINYSATGSISEARNAAIKEAVSAGILFVTAAGNSNANACNYGPAQLGNEQGVITVAATNANNHIADFSNFGSCVSVFAPGVDIFTSSSDSSSSYQTISGTSMSSPFVAGLASYFWSINPDYTISQIKNLIINNNNGQVQSINNDTPNKLAYNLL
jgi:cerevisin